MDINTCTCIIILYVIKLQNLFSCKKISEKKSKFEKIYYKNREETRKPTSLFDPTATVCP